MAINQGKVIESLEELCRCIDRDEFIYQFLAAYGFAKATITRLRDGSRNIANDPDVGLKKHLLFRPVSKGTNVYATAEAMKADPLIKGNDIRFVIATDFDSLVAFDLKADESLDTSIHLLDKQYAFFLPLAGYEKAIMYSEHPADIKASEKMGQLFDLIRERYDTEGRFDPRLRLIFDNRTESNMLLRSLSKRLWEDKSGKRIIPDSDSVVEAFNNVGPNDKATGQIYFLATLSDNPALKGFEHLIKIGYTELTVEQRTKSASKDTTFLEAPVKILGAFDCYNLNPHKFETLIHGVLHAQRLQITMVGSDGNVYHPKEWFTVDLDTAKEVVRRIIDGSIVNFRMNNITNRLVLKK